MFDLRPAAAELARLVAGVHEDRLGGPTPCEHFTVTNLLEHVVEFVEVFTSNARKEEPVLGGGLPADWQTSLPPRVTDMAAAWQDESAWQGRVSAGGIEMPAEQNALVAIEETVLHGWDLARATGQEFTPDEEWLVSVDGFFDAFAEPIASGQGPYGPAVAVPEDASHLDRILGAAGRNPGWTA